MSATTLVPPCSSCNHSAIQSCLYIKILAAGAAFPGLADLLYDEAELGRKEREERWRQIRKHLSDLMIIFRQATRWLNTDALTSAFPL